jgi:hypothetical protein
LTAWIPFTVITTTALAVLSKWSHRVHAAFALVLACPSGSLVDGVAAHALGGVVAPARVHALEPGLVLTSDRLLDYVVHTEPGLTKPYEGESFVVRRVGTARW